MLCAIYFSLTCSESVQYFQFDSEGNMFIFQPASGFTGPSLKVEPGFEMGKYSQEKLFHDSGVVSSDVSDDSKFSSSSTQLQSEPIISSDSKR